MVYYAFLNYPYEDKNNMQENSSKTHTKCSPTVKKVR